ncbi:MAG: ribbon-helix-helix domain-containing protein [Acidobacteriota bacterium]|nr:ribbon-helix-helix domain-containing protein [Acidobacteriota bacterium]
MTISLPDEQAKRLAELCRDEGISRAEAVRRAVNRYLAHHRQREDAFGMWRGRATEGLVFERPLREEWR